LLTSAFPLKPLPYALSATLVRRQNLPQLMENPAEALKHFKAALRYDGPSIEPLQQRRSLLF